MRTDRGQDVTSSSRLVFPPNRQPRNYHENLKLFYALTTAEILLLARVCITSFDLLMSVSLAWQYCQPCASSESCRPTTTFFAVTN